MGSLRNSFPVELSQQISLFLTGAFQILKEKLGLVKDDESNQANSEKKPDQLEQPQQQEIVVQINQGNDNHYYHSPMNAAIQKL